MSCSYSYLGLLSDEAAAWMLMLIWRVQFKRPGLRALPIENDGGHPISTPSVHRSRDPTGPDRHSFGRGGCLSVPERSGWGVCQWGDDRAGWWEFGGVETVGVVLYMCVGRGDVLCGIKEAKGCVMAGHTGAIFTDGSVAEVCLGGLAI